MAAKTVRLIVNGSPVAVQVEEDRTLLYLLREVMGLTGTKEGCGEGDCGACSVLLDGELVNSCLVLAIQAEGREVLTIEGVGGADQLHPIQQAFIEAGAIQCGYCTPGMVLAAKALLAKVPNPSEEEIRRGLSGNLCRCTGYQKIVDAVKLAARPREDN
ncbi:aerobic-type carbon monoxide dehydrogenase, small subunit CoxS/CutS-like protein [Desulfosporosinus orientis DSM 765]|uniref:Aerobic-type carbon monoxide dehydrogenase, small subunit CoxS/CutS-like protein n=1 Tax=Desulfosporosinus orientis (strain ATCC 19365 / DSM 765 / NCIMB 8382 / VKM B-1628 / Singapore I) TaxID=768706 RepID=G7W6J5_DESOD|nr:(2Fe-2S)-binding protein [Desulfosporosinus orientis]AET68633.1 aerobic-type carbon monoxide dehydrogenase, small subunit CoxS/CutS-like protein [Desulfosporosinus orientis DSM 765]